MKTEVIYPHNLTRRKLHKREPITGNLQETGFRSLPDGEEEIVYEVTVNLGMIDAMARKAAGSKGQKSSDGPLTVRVLTRKKIS